MQVLFTLIAEPEKDTDLLQLGFMLLNVATIIYNLVVQCVEIGGFWRDVSDAVKLQEAIFLVSFFLYKEVWVVSVPGKSIVNVGNSAL